MNVKFRFLTSFLVVILLNLVSFSNAQSISKAMKYYQKGDYASSISILNTLSTTETQNAAPFYLLAKIYAEPKYQAYDFFKANAYIQKAFELFPQMSTLEQDKIVDYATWEQITTARKQIEVALFEFLKSKNDPTLTKRFLEECPTSIFTQEAKDLLIFQEFSISEKLNTSSSYQNFLNNYPSTKYTSICLQRIYSLEYAAVQKQNNTAAYLNFISKYPNAPQVQEAKNVVMESDYQLTMKVKTKDAMERFIKKYPSSEYAESLRKLMEKEDLEQAMQLKSVPVYDAFLLNYPNSTYAKEIAELRDSLAFENAKRKNTTEAYFNFLALYPNAKQAVEVSKLSQELHFSWSELVKYRNVNHIKSHSIKCIRRFKNSAKDSNLIALDFQEFLSNGELLKSIEYNEKGSIGFQNSYNEKSNTIQFQSIFENEKEISKKQFLYNNQNLLVLEKEGNKAGEIMVSSSYSYDDRRNCIQKINVNNQNDTVLIVNYTYLQSFTPQEKVTYQFNEASQKFSRQTFVFNGSGVLLQEITTNIDNKVVAVSTNNFDANGLLLSKEIQNQFGKLVILFKYNSFGLIEKEEITYPDMPAYNQTYFYQYEFFE